MKKQSGTIKLAVTLEHQAHTQNPLSKIKLKPIQDYADVLSHKLDRRRIHNDIPVLELLKKQIEEL